MFGMREYFMRESLSGDENVYTQNAKSLNIFTLTVTQILCFIALGGIGLGWALVQVFADLGWDEAGVGADMLVCWKWDGPSVGWVGEIRGGWVVNPVSFSRSHLVVCFFLFIWSVGSNLVHSPTFCHRLLVRGHNWSWLAGIVINPGDIRQDQLGGLSIRCSPICFPTPMLETTVGYRNLLFADNFFVGLGWTEGWDRWLFMSMCWPNVRASCSAGLVGNLGWVMLNTLLLLDLSSRGIAITKGWVWGSSLHIKLDRMAYSWRFVLLAKEYGCSHTSQSNHYSQRFHQNAGISWACSWVRNLWVVLKDLWKQCRLRSKCSQPTYYYCNRERLKAAGKIASAWLRGKFVTSGWVTYSLGVLMGFWLNLLLGLWSGSDLRRLRLLSGLMRLLCGKFGLLWYPPDCFQHDNSSCLAEWDCCCDLNSAPSSVTVKDQTCRGFMVLVLWPRAMWQLLNSPLNPLFVRWLWHRVMWQLGVWPKTFMVGKMCRGKMVKTMTGVFGFMGWDKWKKRTCNAKTKGLWVLAQELFWGAVQPTGPSVLMCFLNMLELIAKVWMFWALHGPFRDSTSSTIIWAYGLIDVFIGHNRLIRVTIFCGPPLMYGPPSIYSSCSVHFVTHYRARVLCIPRVGLLVSYFWSPEHVSGDEVGGMPPVKV
ncbi:hypothetical protein Hanom_Chr01g00000631 [Helianthus anomalus]